jgi:hypothetical protein
MTFTLFNTPFFGPRPFASPLMPRSLGTSFQGLCRWLVDGTPVGLKPMLQTSLRHSQQASVQALKAPQLPVHSASVRPVSARPATVLQRAVRVVHVQESGQPRTSGGRLVISGRMADVCAELDRLVAQEAALH